MSEIAAPRLHDGRKTVEQFYMLDPRSHDDEAQANLLRTVTAVPDLTPDPYLNKLVKTAATICGTPIALVSFLTESLQVFRAIDGLECSSTPRNAAFCNYTIQQDDLFIVPDALNDERFRENPLVSGEPYIRFYAGVRIREASGLANGAICVIDRVPRELDRIQKNNLRQLAMLVESRLRTRTAA